MIIMKKGGREQERRGFECGKSGKERTGRQKKREGGGKRERIEREGGKADGWRSVNEDQ